MTGELSPCKLQVQSDLDALVLGVLQDWSSALRRGQHVLKHGGPIQEKPSGTGHGFQGKQGKLQTPEDFLRFPVFSLPQARNLMQTPSGTCSNSNLCLWACTSFENNILEILLEFGVIPRTICN